ncbi:uncharacterized protein LOC124182548 [Neodiprion fabricii]|uniref:uncharacterized protein LOC124182548 n=1 Tax=Neodiprion fabricii TaxID=2872261 RepID=UPI001ED923AB|nr:uncharacterized protein LOC124182548 [Neodiprion fabricii]
MDASCQNEQNPEASSQCSSLNDFIGFDNVSQPLRQKAIDMMDKLAWTTSELGINESYDLDDCRESDSVSQLLKKTKIDVLDQLLVADLSEPGSSQSSDFVSCLAV